ncbi:MAG: nitrile hydratase subunit beta [Rhizobiales bacterium]|nr:nitrile hydratase subunit beta [Hyphomicrobiales bacterium]
MNGPQDLGGMMGFGPVRPEADEPVFHGEWEKRALALTLASAALGEWNMDMGRHARESLPPHIYLSVSYYEIWTRALANMLAERGMVTAEELAAARQLVPPVPTKKPKADKAQVAAALAKGSPYDRQVDQPARFALGERISTKVMHPATHTRLPRYARGKTGEIVAVHGAFVFPDSHAHGLGEQPQWCYGVKFSGRELWGPDSDSGLEVIVDCWEPYLQDRAA